MLVVEDGHYSLTGAEDLDHLLEEPAAGVELLTFRRERIIAVLRDEQNAIDRQLVSAEGQRLRGRFDQRNAPLPGERPADVRVGHLLDIQRGHPARRRVALADNAVALHEAGDEVVRVAVAVVGGDKRRHLLV